MTTEANYLTNIPQSVEEFGFCKTLAVRREVIHIKHILTEVFVRKTFNIQQYLDKLSYSLMDYMEYMTNRIRRVHHFSRAYSHEINEIVKSNRDDFFPTLQLYAGLNNIIILDFDGVTNKNNFRELYKLCVERCTTFICSANPEVSNEWFIKNELPLPHKIFACKGKEKKIKQLIELGKKYDYCFYVDNELEYLEYAWLFGLQTYHWTNNQIKYFTLKTK